MGLKIVLLWAATLAALVAAQGATPAAGGPTATLTINSDQAGADIQIDGMFIGNSPTTVPLVAGIHRVVLQQGGSAWQRDLLITGGSVTINATLGRPAAHQKRGPRVTPSVDQQTGGA